MGLFGNLLKTAVEIGKNYVEIGNARKDYWKKHDYYFNIEDKKEFTEIKEIVNKQDVSNTAYKLF